eukprot:198606-Amphidinium_carterae.1
MQGKAVFYLRAHVVVERTCLFYEAQVSIAISLETLLKGLFLTNMKNPHRLGRTLAPWDVSQQFVEGLLEGEV